MSSTTLWYMTRASGIVAMVLLTLTMVLGLTTASRARARGWPGFAQQELHRRISMVTIVFVAIHVVTSVLDTYVHIGWLAIVVPMASSYSRFWVGLGAVAIDLMVAVFVSSLLRSRMRPDLWRRLHWLAYGCWPIALAHTFGLGTDAGERWVIVLGALCILSVLVALLWRTYTATRRMAGPTVPAPEPVSAPRPGPAQAPRRLVSSAASREPRRDH